jgi:hypothetical protein
MIRMKKHFWNLRIKKGDRHTRLRSVMRRNFA